MSGLVLRPIGPDDVAELRRIHALPEVARWWDDPWAMTFRTATIPTRRGS